METDTDTATDTATATSRARFREVLGHFASGVTVVTAACGDVVHGMTATAFASLSLDPLMVLICVNQEARLHRLVLESRSFAVTMLSERQHELSSWFALRRRPLGADEFAGCAWRPAAVSRAPVLEGGLGYLDCALTDIHAAGDHSILVGRVEDLGLFEEPAAPLLWYRGGYRRLETVEER